jgi:CheY-like chemotaxis protein
MKIIADGRTKKFRILWTDDEMDLLKPYSFLMEKGYEVETATNGNDAVELIKTTISIWYSWMRTCPD